MASIKTEGTFDLGFAKVGGLIVGNGRLDVFGDRGMKSTVRS